LSNVVGSGEIDPETVDTSLQARIATVNPLSDSEESEPPRDVPAHGL